MDIIDNISLHLSTDQILQAMGSDPAKIKTRKPSIYHAACHALDTGQPLIKPAIAQKTYSVERVVHNSIFLDRNQKITSPLISKELKNAHSLTVFVCSIGSEIELFSRQVADEDPILSMALDALGSTAVEQLIMEICREFEAEASARSDFVSQPFGPGLEGWSAVDGQPVIFQLVDASPAGVHLSPSMLMEPVKSASFILGFSKSPFKAGSTCEYCSLRETCRYRGNHIDAQ